MITEMSLGAHRPRRCLAAAAAAAVEAHRTCNAGPNSASLQPPQTPQPSTLPSRTHKKQRCAAQRVRCAADERAAATRRVRARSHAALNYMHVHCNLISGREREEPIVQILEYEHSDHSVFNACVCLSTLVLFATPWHLYLGNPREPEGIAYHFGNDSRPERRCNRFDSQQAEFSIQNAHVFFSPVIPPVIC